MVGGEHQVLDIVIFIIIATQVAKAARINRVVAAQRAIPVDVIDPAAGTAEEHNIAIGKVDIEIIAVETLARPDGGAPERPGKIGEITHLDVQLAYVQMVAIVILHPRIRVGRAVGQHGFKVRPRPVAEGHFFAEAQLHVVIFLIAETANVGIAVERTGRGDTRTAARAFAVAVDQHPGACVGVKFKAIAQAGFRQLFVGSLLFLLRRCGALTEGLHLLFRCRRTLFCRAGAQLRLLRPTFSLSGLLLRMVKPGLQLRQTLFNAERGRTRAVSRKKGAANRCANQRDTHSNPYFFRGMKGMQRLTGRGFLRRLMTNPTARDVRHQGRRGSARTGRRGGRNGLSTALKPQSAAPGYRGSRL